MRTFIVKLSLAITFLLYIPLTCWGQEKPSLKQNKILFGGDIGTRMLFDSLANQSLSFRSQIYLRPKISINNWQLGTSAMFSFRDKEFASNFSDFLTDYGNNFSAYLKYKTLLRLNMGRVTPSVKGLAICNRSVMGGQLVFRPGKWLFSVFSGKNPARNEDTDLAYALEIWGGEFRYGHPNKSYFGWSFIYGNEDSTSLVNVPQYLKPRRSTNVGIYSQIKFSQWYTMKIELGGSLFTENIGLSIPKEEVLAKFLSDEIPFKKLAKELQKRSSWGPFFRNVTSRPGLAAKVGLERKSRHFTLGIQGEYYSAGYNSLAALYQETDYLNVGLNTSIRLFENRFFIRGKVGVRLNQFYQNTATENLELQVQTSLNLRFIPNRTFSITGKYNNLERTVVDGIGDYSADFKELIVSRLVRKSHLVSITPQVNLGKNKKHRLWATYKYNVLQSATISYDSQIREAKSRKTDKNLLKEGRLGYSYNSKIIRSGIDASYLESDPKGQNFSQFYTMKPWVKLTLLKRKLSLKCSFKTAFSHKIESKARQYYTRIDFSYRLTKKITFQLNGSESDHVYLNGDSNKKSILLISSLNIKF